MKNKVLFQIISMILLVPFLLPSCSDEDFIQEDYGNTREFILSPSNYMIDGISETLPEESVISNMIAYRFVNGKLVEIIEPFTEGGVYKLKVNTQEGQLYVIANTDKLSGWTDMKVGDDETLLVNAIVTMEGEVSHYFTSYYDFDTEESSGKLSLLLKRGVARFDIVGLSDNIMLQSIVFKNISEKAYLLPHDKVMTPQGSAYKDYPIEFDNPLSDERKGLFYTYEQVNHNIELVLEVLFNGEIKTVRAGLSGVAEIKRNNVYTLQINDASGNLDVNIKVDEWGDGGETGLKPDITSKLTIDEKNSVLNGNVVNEEKNGLEFSHYANDIVLALSSDVEMELIPFESDVVDMTPLVGDDGMPVRNKFSINKKLLPPGRSFSSLPIYFKRKGADYIYDKDCITLSFKDNPTKLEGKLAFDLQNRACRFDTYIDNELGVFEVEDGKEVVVSKSNDEDPWLIVKTVDGFPNKYRIVAGWKPNDPKGDGRLQEAKIIIRDKSASENSLSEEYTVSRKNYSLPVTYLNGNWWCNYNSLGTSTDFEDQILYPEDPAMLKNQTVQEYLKTCSNDEFVRIWNSSYMGDDGESMPLIYDGSKFTLKGYRHGESIHINSVDKYKLSPSGYEMPTLDDYNSIFGAIFVNTSWAEYNPHNGNSNYRLKAIRDIHTGVVVDGHTVPDETWIITVTSIRGHGGPLTFYSVGCQWNNNGINSKWHIYACYKTENISNAWALATSAWLEAYRGVAANNTRIIRFKKSPVEYMYGDESLPNPWR